MISKRQATETHPFETEIASEVENKGCDPSFTMQVQKALYVSVFQNTTRLVRFADYCTFHCVTRFIVWQINIFF